MFIGDSRKGERFQEYYRHKFGGHQLACRTKPGKSFKKVGLRRGPKLFSGLRR